MKEKKNIDRIFQEKFKDFEKEPSEKVWNNIASRLDKKDKKKPLIIPLWLKFGGVAAVMAAIIASLLFTNHQQSATDNPEVVFENPEKSTEDQNEEKNSSKENSVKGKPAEQIVSEKHHTGSKAREKDAAPNHKSSSHTAIADNENTSANKKTTDKKMESNSASRSTLVSEWKNSNNKKDREVVADSQQAIKNDSSVTIAQAEITEIDSTKTESILEENNALAKVEEEKKNKEEETIAEIDSKRMRLSTFAAPVFYKNIGSGNELSNQLSNNATSSQVTLSYGVKIAYKISKKLKIRTGISKIDINNNIQDISYSPSAMAASFENLSSNEEYVEITDNSPLDSGLPTEMGENNSLTSVVSTPGEINQQFGYIEVPIELEYALIDKNFGLTIIGGGSSLFLDNNRVQLVSGEVKTDLGKATNINSTSFSTNIGLGMDYKLTDKFSINVEPIFKYQINTFDKVNNVQPVNFGVYSGLSFKF